MVINSISISNCEQKWQISYDRCWWYWRVRGLTISTCSGEGSSLASCTHSRDRQRFVKVIYSKSWHQAYIIYSIAFADYDTNIYRIANSGTKYLHFQNSACHGSLKHEAPPNHLKHSKSWHQAFQDHHTRISLTKLCHNHSQECHSDLWHQALPQQFIYSNMSWPILAPSFDKTIYRNVMVDHSTKLHKKHLLQCHDKLQHQASPRSFTAMPRWWHHTVNDIIRIALSTKFIYSNAMIDSTVNMTVC
jgi:hypothetical protein